MAHSTRTLRIGIASLIAVLLIAGAYAFSGPTPLFNLGRIAEAQSSEELLREYAVKDTDADGLPDWQEALYGTDPANPESFKAGVKDGEAVAQGLVQPKVVVRADGDTTDAGSIPGISALPDSITDRFAQALLTQYLRTRGDTPPTQEEIVAFVQKGVSELSSSSEDADRFTIADVRVTSETGREALIAYAAKAEKAFADNTVPSTISSRNELSYFQDAIRGNDGALTNIRALSAAYEDIAEALMAVPVPAEARQAHLSIANTLVHLSTMTEDMAALKTDPLRALLGIGLYEKYASRLKSGFANMHSVFSARQATLTEGQPGYEFYATSELSATP